MTAREKLKWTLIALAAFTAVDLVVVVCLFIWDWDFILSHVTRR